MIVSHLFTVIELCILSVFFTQSSWHIRLKRLVAFANIIFFVAAVLNVFLLQNIHSYNSYTRSVEALIIVLLSVYNFTILMDNSGKPGKSYIAEVYFTSAILLYFSGAFLIFATFNLFDIAIGLEILIWNTHATFLLLMYLLLAIGLWKLKR
jgi:hypothetical protein